MGAYRFADLPQRAKTAVILIPLFLIMLYLGGWFLWVTVLFALTVALSEFQDLYQRDKPLLIKIPFWFFLWSILLLSFLNPERLNSLLIPSLIPLIFFLLFPFLKRRGLSFLHGGAFLTATLILGIAGLSVTYLRKLGFFPSLFLFVTLWTSDSAALFLGRIFGHHRFPAYISPSKSLEGFVGGLLGSLLTGVLALFLFPHWFSSPIYFLLASLLVSFTGQIGDLSESALKREAGVKDTSDLFPGHGGILDRIDSVIGSSFFFAVYLSHFGRF